MASKYKDIIFEGIDSVSVYRYFNGEEWYYGENYRESYRGNITEEDCLGVWRVKNGTSK